MFFEFQMSTITMLSVVRNHLHHQNLCVADTFPFQGMELMVDRIHILKTTRFDKQQDNITIQVNGNPQVIQGEKPVLIQPIQLDLVNVNTLEQNDTHVSPPVISPIIDVHIDVTIIVAGNQAELQLTFSTIDFGLFSSSIPTDVQQQIIAIVGSIVQPVIRQIDISSIQNMLFGIQLTVTNAGVIVISEGDTLALRLEINGSANQVGFWTDFFNTYDRDLTDNNDWALLLDADLLESSIRENIENQMAGASSDFSMDGNVSVTWSPSFGPVFKVSFSGEVIDACTCFWGEIDLDVDVSTSVTLQVPAKNVLRTRIRTTYDADDLEVFCCSLTAALFWPVVGIIYMADGKVNFGSYLLGLLGTPIGVFIAVCVVAGNQNVADQVGGQGQCTKINDETIRCDENVSINMGPFGGVYTLTSVSALTEGPVMSGAIGSLTELNEPKISVTSSEGFSWGLGGSCSRGFKAVLSGGCIYNNTVPGSILNLCDVSVIDDPLNTFQKIETTNYSITVRPQLTDEYLADPYPCKIMIISNGGVRIISLSPAEEITEDEKTLIQNQFLAAKMQCFKEIMLPYKIMKFKWLPDPPPIKNLAQIWQIVVSEMADNEVVEILDGKGSVLASAVANERKVAQLSAFFEGEAVTSDLAVKIGLKAAKSAMSPPKRKQKRVKRHVSIKQIQLALKSSISPIGSFEGLAVIREGRQTLLKYNTNIGEFIWDISVPEFPSLLSTITDKKKGKTIYTRQDKMLILSGSDLKVVNDRKKVFITLTKSGIKKVAVRGNRLYSMSSQEIRIFNLDNPDSPESLQMSKGTLESIVQIKLAKLAGVKECLCLIDKKGNSRIIDVSDRMNPKELGRYFQTPWFLDGQKFGKLFVRFSRETGKIMIYFIEQVVEN